jgi:hypothetical protein
MNFNSIVQYLNSPVQGTLTGIVNSLRTIDGTPIGPCGDNGALANQRRMTPWASADLSPSQAATNLLRPELTALLYDWSLTIVGHACPGVIACGGGQCPSDTQNVTFYNQNDWEPLFEKIRPPEIGIGQNGKIFVFLDGCQAGAEYEGLQLLQSFLKTTDAQSVSAPTGLLLCNGITEWYDPPNAPIQTVTQGAPLPPVLPPLGSDTEFTQNGQMVFHDNGLEAFESDIDQVKTVTLKNPSAKRSGDFVKMGTQSVWDRSDSFGRHLLNSCNFAQPIRLAGLPLAQKTLELTLEFPNVSDDARKLITLVSLSDTLLQDRDFPDIYYRTTPEFRSIAKEIRNGSFSH